METFAPLTRLLDGLEKEMGIPACDCVIAKDGKVIYRHSAGPVTPQTTYWLYSTTKLLTCTAAMQLIEQGKLSLDDPVSRYLPEFGRLQVREVDGTVRPAETTLTVFHLMTMAGGLDYDVNRPALAQALGLPEEQRTTRNVVAALSKDPLLFEPGAHFLYSLCHDVLAAVIEVASGQRFADYIKEHILQPLGMTDTTFHPNQDQLDRLADFYFYEEGTLTPRSKENEFRFGAAYDSGGAGLLGTVSDYIRFLSALSVGGQGILQPESIAKMASPWLNEAQLVDFWNRSAAAKGYSYGLGVRVLEDNTDKYSAVGEFGWDGAAGAYALVDPKNRIALFYAMQIRGYKAVFQSLHPRLRDVAGQCLRCAGLAE